jgi:hypothetical protein
MIRTRERPTVFSKTPSPRSKTARGGSRQYNAAISGVNHPMRGAFALEPQRPTAGGNRPLSIESWKMIDVSAGGYCLLWESNDVSSAQVGELVAIRRTSADGGDEGWKLGVIRWMKFTPDRGLVLGMQQLASLAIPVWASSVRGQISGCKQGARDLAAREHDIQSAADVAAALPAVSHRMPVDTDHR